MTSSPLKSVNWSTGMLLTPEHFRAQDEFVENAAGWDLRFLSGAAGLVGGGPRAGASAGEQFDPDVDILDDGEMVSAHVRSARGITPSGRIIDFTDADAISGMVPRDEVTGRSEIYVAIIHTGEREPDPNSLNADEENRGLIALRRPRYDVTLVPSAANISDALVIARLRRGDAGKFVRDEDFIPPCVSVIAHSRMTVEWRRLLNVVRVLAEDFADLHRHAATYIGLLEKLRGPAPVDRGILGFIERAALACDTCAYALLDGSTAPAAVFRQIALAGRRASIALDLLTQAAEFLRIAPETNTELSTFLNAERNALKNEMDSSTLRDLRGLVIGAFATLDQLDRLRRIVDEKYDDYRDSRVLLRLPYLLDRGTVPRVFDAVKHVTYAAEGAMRRFTFPDLAGSRPGAYRVALIGNPDAVSSWIEGSTLSTNTIVAPAGGGTPRSVSSNLICERPQQRNFVIDLDQMTTANMTSIRVDVLGRADWFENAVLYRLYDGEDRPVVVAEPAKAPETKAKRTNQFTVPI